MSAISVLWEKLRFDRFTGGCHTPLTHAAIDRTLTTILFSFPSVQKKKLPAVGGRLVCCHISIQGIKFELHAGLYPSAIHDHTISCYFTTKVKKSHSGRWMSWHFIRLFDWRNHVLIQIVSETEPGMAVLQHVTPAMPHKFQGDWSWSYFYGRSLFAADLYREIVMY